MVRKLCGGGEADGCTGKERRKSAPIDGNGNLTEDLLFSSPSYAAMFVIGKSTNGLTSWKTEDNRTLKSIEEG